MRRQIKEVWESVAMGLFALVVIALCQPAYGFGGLYVNLRAPGLYDSTSDLKLVLRQPASVISKRQPVIDRRLALQMDGDAGNSPSVVPAGWGRAWHWAMRPTIRAAQARGAMRAREPPRGSVV